jgi:hypothetical protein
LRLHVSGLRVAVESILGQVVVNLLRLLAAETLVGCVKRRTCEWINSNESSTRRRRKERRRETLGETLFDVIKAKQTQVALDSCYCTS